jgi:hypothetical protein
MKQRHPYYYLTKQSDPCHRFAVYSSCSADLVEYFNWDGGDLVSKGCAFGMPHGFGPQEPLPEEVSHLVPRLKELFVIQQAKGGVEWIEDPQVCIKYEGYTAKRRVECVIVLDRQQEDYVAYHEEATFLVDQAGSVTPSHGCWPSCSSEARTFVLNAPLKVYDYRSSLPVMVRGKFAKENFHFGLTDIWKNSSLIKMIAEDRLLGLQEYNAKYHLIPDLDLEVFQPSLSEWQRALDDLGPTEKNLIALLDNPELFRRNPTRWQLSQRTREQIPIARAFLGSDPKCLAIFNRLIWHSTQPLTVWQALLQLDPEFPYPIFSSPVIMCRLPSQTLLADPTLFHWLPTKDNAWLFELFPNQVKQ